MPFETLISTNELDENLHRQDWVIVDCRFELSDPDRGQEEYRQLHIPGAIYAHADHDLAGVITFTSGRHPLPDPTQFCKTMSRFGISQSTQVIAYDASTGSFASRLWFLLRFYGHKNVAVLDGGFAQWCKRSFSVESGWIDNQPAEFTGSPNITMVTSTNEVFQNLGNPEYLLIDARAPERYSGAQETIDIKAGHNPGAVNRYYGMNITSEGLFRPPEELHTEFQQLTKAYKPQNISVYCGSGITSTHHLLAMAVAGLPQVKLYAGSWSEWIRDPTHPIATGE